METDGIAARRQFWLLNGTLLPDSTPLAQAEPYGVHLTHPRSHVAVWNGWRKLGKVPVEVPYEEPPCGRVLKATPFDLSKMLRAIRRLIT